MIGRAVTIGDDIPAVVITEARTGDDLIDTLERAGLRTMIAGQGLVAPRVLILIELAGLTADDPSQLDASMVEGFIDLVLRFGGGSVVLAASADSSRLRAGNRDVHALAELAGYRYVTNDGNEYDIVDLGELTRDDVFPEGSALVGTPASAEWLDADIRIVFAAVRANLAEGFSAGLRATLGALPLVNKTFHYAQRRDAGEVVSALLATAAPHFVVLDGRSVAAEDTGIVIAGRSLVLADIAAGLKLGLDPLASPLVATVAARHPPPANHRCHGDLAPLEGISIPSPLERRWAEALRSDPMAETLAATALQPVDGDRFPLMGGLDARLNAALGAFGDDKGASGVAIRMMAGLAAEVTRDWRVMFDKDSLVRRTVSLGVDPGAFDTTDFIEMVQDLDSLAPIARSGPARGPHLRWRKLGGAVVFAYERRLAIPFDRFVARVEVAKAIQYMNDYIGGVIVAVAWDADGRPVRQFERNLYLPQPNYLVLYGGTPIDVTKIEVAERSRDRHRLCWKTLFSDNGSATSDDGVVTFARDGEGVMVSIVGRQDFTLPPFWRMFDVGLIPALDVALTTHAYTTFFDRTLANFEALTEGRDIAIGRPLDAPDPAPSAEIERAIRRVVDAAEPWLERLRPVRAVRTVDTDGFVHVRPGG